MMRPHGGRRDLPIPESVIDKLPPAIDKELVRNLAAYDSIIGGMWVVDKRTEEAVAYINAAMVQDLSVDLWAYMVKRLQRKSAMDAAEAMRATLDDET